MSEEYFFEVSVTPPKKRKIIPIAEEKELLTLAPFTPIPKLEFNDVKVSTIATKVISVFNPASTSVKVNFDVGNVGEEVKIDPSEIEVGPKETIDVSVIWLAPPVPANFRYTVNTKCSTHKKLPHLLLICHCTAPKGASKKHKSQIKKKNDKFIKDCDLNGKDRRSTYVKPRIPREALKSVNTLERINTTYVKENVTFSISESENLPPEIPRRYCTPTPENISREKLSIFGRKRRCNMDDSQSCKADKNNSETEDALTSTPNKVDSPKFRDSLEYSFETISSIANDSFNQYQRQDETIITTKTLSETVTKKTNVTYFDTECSTPLSKDIIKDKAINSENWTDKSQDDAKLTVRPMNHRTTYTVSSSRMAQSMTDIASYFQSIPDERRYSKSTQDLNAAKESLFLVPPPIHDFKTLRSDIDRKTFVVNNSKKPIRSSFSASADNLEKPANFSFRPRSLSTSITYLDSKTFMQLNDTLSPSQSNNKRASTVYSAFFHEPENIPVNEDPFSRKNIEFHTEEWLQEREYELLNWLNALMTPPVGWEGISQLTIEAEDIAKMWHAAARAKTLLLPPTKETLACQSLLESDRMNTLRIAANQLFISPEVRQVHDWLRAQISKKNFEVKNDVDLGKNQGSKVLIVQMLMRYNPLWLRIGLEAIFKTTIHLQSINDWHGIIMFLQKYLLNNDLVEKKVASKMNYKIKMENWRAEMNAYVVEKFLLLIFFLDKAKSKRLIPFDPCLFMKNSPIKVSEELLDEFIREFMKCTGGMKNNMKRIGYLLTYHQTCLDEFDYSVKNRLDVRDGIRLTRAVEIILKRNDLGKQLRAPVVSILQKVNNVQVALNALKSEGFTIIGDITAKDIVNGHREKTLSLLWQILNKFIKTRFEFSAKKIQIWWRKKSLLVEINRRIRHKNEVRMTNASLTLQKYWRGRCARKWFVENKEALKQEQEIQKQHIEKMNSNAVLIQQWYKKWSLVRKNREYFLKLKSSTVIIQKWYRSCIMIRQTRNDFILMRKSAIKIQRWYKSYKQSYVERDSYLKFKSCVILIQRRFRANKLMKLCHEEYSNLKVSVLKIQRLYRAKQIMKKERQVYLLKRNSTIKIQQRFKSYKQMNVLRNKFINLRMNVIKIQRWYRSCALMKSTRKSYLDMKESVCYIENRYLDYKAMKQCRAEFLIKKLSALKIQRWYRASKQMRIDRKMFMDMKESAVVIQSRFRSYREMKAIRSKFISLKFSSIKLQTYFRSYLLMREQRGNYLKIKSSVLLVQQRFRCYLEMKKTRSEYLLVKISALKIQRWFRTCQMMQSQRLTYLRMRRSAIVIQEAYRSYTEMKKCRNEFLNLKSAAVKIQCWYKACLLMRYERENYLLKKRSAIMIQRAFKGFLLMKSIRSQYLLKISSCIKIQMHYRAWCLMKADRKKYLNIMKSVDLIQAKFRSYLLMRQCREIYLNQKCSAGKIQNWFRASRLMKLERKRFISIKQSALVIQRSYKSYLLMKETRSRYLLQKASAVKIQQWFRACTAMRNDRLIFLSYKSSALLIQTAYRGYIQMKICKSDYLIMKSSAIKIQNWFRACQLMKYERENFVTLKRSVEAIQRRFRGYIMMRKNRIEYLSMKLSAVKIQVWFRSCQLMKQDRENYLKLKQSVELIQCKFRSNVEMKNCRNNYLRIKTSAIKIQNKFRAYRLMKYERQNFLNLKHAALLIQRKYKEYILMKKQRNQYLLIRASSIKIQIYFRSYLQMKNERDLLLRMKQSAILIQNKFRSYKKMQYYRRNFLILRSSTLKIQSWFKACLLMKVEREHYLILKQSTVTIQSFYRSYKLMKCLRSDYLQMRESVCKIQHCFRRNQQLKRDRNNFVRLKSATILIQSSYRAYKLKTTVRSHFLRMKMSAIKIQRWFRTIQNRKLMEKVEARLTYYTTLNAQAIKIQRWYRNLKTAKTDRHKFIKIKRSVMIIQQAIRSYNAMKICQADYLRRKSSCIKIQQWYRANKLMKDERMKYIKLKKSIIQIQRIYRQKKEQNRLLMEILQIRNQAATKIQSKWKGYKVQKKYSAILSEMKAKADKDRDQPLNSQPLRQRYIDSLKSLKTTSGSLAEKLELLLNFNRLTKYSKELSAELSVCVAFHKMLWFTLDAVNRAPHYFEVCDAGLNILINLAKANPKGLFKVMTAFNAMDILFRLMTKYISVRSSLFCKCATIIWLLMKEPAIALASVKKDDFMNRLNRFEFLSSQTKSSFMNKIKAQSLKSLPLSRIDGGYSGKFQYCEFQDNLFAIQTILNDLNKYSKLR